MNEKEKAFVSELRALMAKYEVEIDSETDYDGADEPCGNTYYFTGKDFNVSMHSL